MSNLFNPNKPKELAAVIAKTGLEFVKILQQTLKFAVPASRSSNEPNEKNSIHGSESETPKTP